MTKHIIILNMLHTVILYVTAGIHALKLSLVTIHAHIVELNNQDSIAVLWLALGQINRHINT